MAVRLERIKELVSPNVPKAQADASGVIISPGDLPMDWRIDFEERAAILEYDGGLAREEAEARALREILKRIRRTERM